MACLYVLFRRTCASAMLQPRKRQPHSLLCLPTQHLASHLPQMVAETGHHNEQYLRSLVLEEGALEAANAHREALAGRADIAANMDNLMAGPLAQELTRAIDVVTEAVENRHGPAWTQELRKQDVSEDVWLAHLYQLLYDLQQTTQVCRSRPPTHPYLAVKRAFFLFYFFACSFFFSF